MKQTLSFSLIILFIANLLFSSCEDESLHYIFIGDSLIDNYDTEKYFPSLYIKNEGVSGSTVQDCQNMHLDCRGYVAVLLVGTNDLHEDFNDNFIHIFIEEYTNLIERLHADKVIAISLLPRKNFNNEKIELLNQSLCNSLSSRNDVIFLNVFDDFYKNNTLDPEYTTDGLHLNYMGYILLTERLNKVL
jgi:lysophospholipase L1-like esterase